VGYQNKDVDRLIEQLRRTFDEAERVKICHQIGAIFHADQPYTFLFTPSSLSALSGRYRNARMFPGGLAEDLLWTPRAEQRKVPGL
jgi:peptide/nickel transport system substrate-binding protein